MYISLWENSRGHPDNLGFMQFSTKIDGFEQKDSQGFENSYNSYEQYPLEKFLIFTIYQNYTLALRSIKAYLCPNMIDFDAVDFSERCPEEVMFLLTLSLDKSSMWGTLVLVVWEENNILKIYMNWTYWYTEQELNYRSVAHIYFGCCEEYDIENMNCSSRWTRHELSNFF